MYSPKRGWFLVFVALFFAVLAFQIYAEEGCYTYPDGDESLYCQTGITREEAQADCSRTAGCDMNQHFLPGRSCADFSQCKQVKCTVDCQRHALGKCEQLGLTRGDGAEVLKGKEVLSTPEDDSVWCAPRCCKASTYCSRGLVKKWDCQLGAFRSGVLDFNSISEDFAVDTAGCINVFCGAQLQPGSLAGLVQDSQGHSIAGAQVALDGQPAQTTTADGHYTFPNLPARSYIAHVSKVGFASLNQEVRIGSGQALEHNFILLPGGVGLSGTILNQQTNQGIPGATVSWRGSGQGVVVADNTGHYEITGLAPGAYNFTASKAGFTSQDFPDTLNEFKTHDFTLIPSARQVIEGRTTIEGVAQFGVTILVNGARRGFSRAPEGNYIVDLNPGRYKVAASFSDFGAEQADVVVEVGKTTTVNLDLVRVVPVCGPANFKPVAVFSGSPVPGEQKIKLQWQKPCPEVVSYEIKRIHNGQPEGQPLAASALDFSAVDNKVQWGQSYEYEMKVLYQGEGGESPVVKSVPILVGDAACEGQYDTATQRWNTFCRLDNDATLGVDERKVVWSCDNNNQLISINCLSVNDFCARAGEKSASCKDGGVCGVRAQIADPFGLYYTRSTCYGSNDPLTSTSNFCYFDYTESSVDACQSCTNVQSCFGYQSKDACEINNCVTSPCTWVDGADHSIINYDLFHPLLPSMITPETGHGYCVPQKSIDDTQCNSCSPSATLFENYFCTAEVCTGLGRCFSSSALDTCNSCGETPSPSANCYTYQTDLECIAQKEGFAIDSGRLRLSEDRCGWGRCAWKSSSGAVGDSGTCFKDGNADAVDDCENLPVDRVQQCRQDYEAPQTALVGGASKISLASPAITFHAQDSNSFLGNVQYCLLPVDSSSTYCDPAIFEQNKVAYLPSQRSADLTINLISSVQQESVPASGQAYRLQYYSQDEYFNQEELREAIIIIDNVAPLFEITESITTLADRSALQVFLQGENEPMSCQFDLQPLLPRSALQSKTAGKDILNKEATFDDIDSVFANLTVTCIDTNGNTNSKSKWYTFDQEQRIDILEPEAGASVASTRIAFRVHTDVGATCELRTVGQDEKVADFLPSEDWKEHQTEALSGFAEDTYLNTYKVVCLELLNQTEEMTDYFSFSVDFTAPDTQVILQEGIREERPILYGWESFFVREALVDFDCRSSGFACASTLFCLGDGCGDKQNPNYQPYTGTVSVQNTTSICYYSTDAGGNSAVPWCGKVTVDGYGITMTSPIPYTYQNQVWGMSSQPTFAWEFFSKVPTVRCAFDFLPGFEYSDVPQIQRLESINSHYAVPAFPSEGISAYPTEGGVKSLYVLCENAAGEVGPEHLFYLEYDPSNPLIVRAFANPTEVLQGTRTALTVDTDDKALCRYSDNSEGQGRSEYGAMEFSFPGLETKNLETSHQDIFSINFMGATKNYQLLTQCANGAGSLSDIRNISFMVDYSILGNIISLAPSGFIRDTSVILEVKTNKNAQCSYRQNVTYEPLESVGGVVHQKQLNGLTEGVHLIPVRCTIGDHRVENQIKFTIDRTAPAITSIQDGNRTCGLNQFDVLVYSNEANLTNYYYELFERGAARNRVPVPSNTSSNSSAGSTASTSSTGILFSGLVPATEPFTIQGINLTLGMLYTVRVRATDAAGNQGQFAESDGVLAVSRNDSSCRNDLQAPRVIPVVNRSCTSLHVQLDCQDSTGCRNFKYGLKDLSGSCVANQAYSGQGIEFTKSGTLCYTVEDMMGHNTSKSELITFADTDGDGIENSCDQCAATQAGAIAGESGCASDQNREGEQRTDTDKDGLPDYFEKLYEQCGLNYLSPDQNNDGILDRDEDYDTDTYSAYEEYLAGSDPCSATDIPMKKNESIKPPVNQGEPTAPSSEKSNVLAWIFLIVGILSVFGGVIYLIYYYKYSAPSASGRSLRGEPQPARSFGTATGGVLDAWSRRLLESRKNRTQQSKTSARQNVFSTFSKNSNVIPHLGNLLSKKEAKPADVHQIAQRYTQHKDEILPGLRQEEKTIFSKLESIAKQAKGKKVEDIVSPSQAKNLFAKLKEISQKRKK